MNPYVKDWFFPFPPREEQVKILEFIHNTPKRVLAVDAPTGVGKSPICMTLANVDSGIILTTQKILQDQYQRDWPTIPLLKGANNYVCGEALANNDKEKSCETGRKMYKCALACPYTTAKDRLMEGRLGVTNYAYAMASSRSEHSRIPAKNWLILDEGHHAENALVSAAEVMVTGGFCFNVLKTPYEQPKTAGAAIDYCGKLLALAKAKAQEMEDEQSKGAAVGLKLERVKAYAEVTNLISSLELMLSDDDGVWIHQNLDRGEGFTLKPLKADGLFKRLIMPLGKRVYITSATMFNAGLMAKWLGIPADDFAFYDVGSPFPIDNRLMHYMPVAPMDFKNYTASLPKMIRAIRKIMESEAFRNKKGIIHTNSFKLSKDIAEGLGSPRILAHDSQNRERMLMHHVNSPDPTVLVSPSMTEGVDLKGDLARFTIFPKVPYPSLGDLWTKKRADMDREWYTWQTLKNVVQGVGRSVRTHDDYAEAYMLDECWGRFWQEARPMAPTWFRKAVVS